MKHFVNSANVGIKFRTGVPFFAENHCRVNQLFNIYSVLDSQYIVCFREKAFHTYCLTGSEQRFFTIGYVGFFYGKIPCLFLLFKITNGRTQLLFAVFYPLITLAFSLLQLYKYDRISIKQAAVAAVVHTPVRPAQFNAMVNRYEIHLYLRIIIHRRNPILTLSFCNICFFSSRSRPVAYTDLRLFDDDICCVGKKSIIIPVVFPINRQNLRLFSPASC